MTHALLNFAHLRSSRATLQIVARLALVSNLYPVRMLCHKDKVRASTRLAYQCSPYGVRPPSREMWITVLSTVGLYNVFRLLLEEVLYVVIWYHLLLEGISTSLRRLDHLDNL